MCMKENNSISVILPFFNNRHTIERAVFSVLSQSYSNWELIVVDDGSEDDGLALIERVEDSRIRCYRLPHQNANTARNYGITHSYGAYIAMLDADDEWTENHLACSLAVLQKEKVDGIYGSLILREKNDKVVITRALQPDKSWVDFLLSNGYAAQTSTLFMTSMSVKNILWNETLLRHQDYDFVVRYCKEYRMCPKMEATTIYHYSQVPKIIDFDSCIRFINSVEHEISDHVYMNYHLQMLHQAVTCSTDEAIIQYYRKAATRCEYLLSLSDYLILRKPQSKMDALKIKMRYLWNIFCTPLLIQD